MTRIVQLANFYSPYSGGLKTVLEELAGCYAEVGVERVLIAPGPTDAVDVDERGTRIFVKSPVAPGTGGYRLVVQPKRVVRLLESLEPDAVELSDKLTMVGPARWARRRGIPTTLLSHERIDAILARRVPGKWALRQAADRWNRRLVDAVDAVVCPSLFARHEFTRIGAGHVQVVPWGVDLETFHPRAADDLVAVRRAEIELVCVGRLSKEKEPDVALAVVDEMVRRGHDVHLTMVGTGPMADALAATSRHLPVTFAGHQHGRAEVAAALAAADVTVAPCRAETFGLSVLESLACGTPVVTAETGAAPEVSGPVAGRAASTPAAMADAILDLVGCAGLDVGDAARRRAEEFTWEQAAQALLRQHARPSTTSAQRPPMPAGVR